MAETRDSLPRDPAATEALLAGRDYIAGPELATVVFLALAMRRPLLVEGETGVGKTELARVLSDALGRELIRLQCYEGLDLAAAAWEWNYPRQLLAIRSAESGGGRAPAEDSLYRDEFLIRRPLLRALDGDPKAPPVLLIDEIDRADEPFEAFLLELLSDFRMTIPELGTIEASAPPIVVITSNRTREVHDALRRRCLYHWLDFPSFDVEREILERRAPALEASLREDIVKFVQRLRGDDLFKKPGVAETIDWAEALLQLGAKELSPAAIDASLGALLKYQDDVALLRRADIDKRLQDLRSAH
mgnify:CR=1 FL=1